MKSNIFFSTNLSNQKLQPTCLSNGLYTPEAHLGNLLVMLLRSHEIVRCLCLIVGRTRGDWLLLPILVLGHQFIDQNVNKAVKL